MIIFIIYLIGVILSYFRGVASWYELCEDADGKVDENFNRKRLANLLISLLSSWMGFFFGMMTYLIENDKYLFKI